MKTHEDTKAGRLARLFNRLSELGFEYGESCQLRRIEMTLSRWGELECGDGNDHASWAIERDEQSNLPYLVTYPHQGKTTRRRIPDRETGALKRLARIMDSHPDFVAYHQGDPRGCSLYIVRRSDVPEGATVDQLYTRGLAVCS